MRMNNIQIMLGLLIAVSFPLQFCSEPRKDVKGWDKVRWGMKEIDIRIAYKMKVAWLGKTWRVRNFYGSTVYLNLELRNFETCGGKFRVFFFMDKIRNGRLKAVEVDTEDEYEGNANNIEIFKCLQQRFIEKYGAATVKEDKPVNGRRFHRRVWEFPSSIIELDYSEYRFGTNKYVVKVVCRQRY